MKLKERINLSTTAAIMHARKELDMPREVMMELLTLLNELTSCNMSGIVWKASKEPERPREFAIKHMNKTSLVFGLYMNPTWRDNLYVHALVGTLHLAQEYPSDNTLKWAQMFICSPKLVFTTEKTIHELERIKGTRWALDDLETLLTTLKEKQ